MPIVVASIDIGKYNLGCYVERFSARKLLALREEYHSLPRQLRRKIKGPVNKEMESIIDRICMEGETLDIEVKNFTTEKEKEYTLDHRRTIISFLEGKRQLWEMADFVIIEQQFFFAKAGKAEVNLNAHKIGETILTWMIVSCPNVHCEVFPATFKTQCLGAPDKMTKYQRKKWSCDKAGRIAYDRKDEVIFRYFSEMAEKRQKGDDASDAIIQCQAWKYRSIVIA